MIIADSSVKLDKDGKFIDEWVSARVHGVPAQVESSRVTHVDAAHKEILGVSASLIPFVEKNRVDRSLMACAMQKQAVPLLKTDSPTVGTGIEGEVAKNTKPEIRLLRVPLSTMRNSPSARTSSLPLCLGADTTWTTPSLSLVGS